MLAHPDAMRSSCPAWDHPAWDGVNRKAIAGWQRDPHYELRICDLMLLVDTEEGERRRANAEPDEATEIATAADEGDEIMRREYVVVEVDEVEAASDGDSGSAWGAPAPIDGEGGLHRQMAFSAADVDGQWSYRIPLASASSGRPTVQVPQHGPSHKDLTINLTSTPPQRPRRRSWRRAGSSSRTNWGACEVQSTMVGEGISGRVGEYLRARGRRGGSTFPFSFLSTPRDNGTPFPPFFRDTFRSRCSLWRWEQACER